ncbi:NADP-dependent oxidoreductase domain, partial [Trinorchestia longiramus]
NMTLPPTFVEGFHDLASIKKLKFVKIGKTDMVGSHVGIGGCSAGGEYGEVDDQETVLTIMEAVQRGINIVDTSPNYGCGRSERVIGQALRQLPRKSFYISTKVGRYGAEWKDKFDFSARRAHESIDASLERLGLDYVDLVLAHDVEFALDVNQVIDETLPAMQEMVKQGKARYIGISGYPLSTLKDVIERSTVPIDVVMSYCRCTLMDQELLKYVPYFQSRGLGLMNASVTGMSLLTPQGPPYWHPALDPIIAAATRANQLCESRGSDIARIATQFTVATCGAQVNILGCRDRDVLHKNWDAATEPPTPEERQLAQDIQT